MLCGLNSVKDWECRERQIPTDRSCREWWGEARSVTERKYGEGGSQVVSILY